MNQNEISGQKPKRRSRAGLVLLIILLLLIGLAGFLYYSVVKAPLELDNPQKMAASKPMSAEERFRFSPAEGTVQVRLDTSDIWSLILDQAGKDFLDTVNQELSGYPVSVSGCALRLNEEEQWLDLELICWDVRVVARVALELEASGKHFLLRPTGAKLGVISLPVGKLLSSVKYEFDLDLPVLSEVNGVSFAQDGILLTGTMEQDIRGLLPDEERLDQAEVFLDSMQFLADSLQTREGYAALLSGLEQDPAMIETLYRDLFALAGSKLTADYLEDRYGLTERFFPGIDFSALEAEQEAISEQLRTRSGSLEQFFTRLVNDYNDKKFRLSGGEFLRNKKPFRADQYGNGDFEELFELLDPESFFLILVQAENGYIRNTPSFYNIADEKQQFTQEIDFNRTYILGCVFRSVTGKPFLMYEAEVQANNSYSRNIVIIPLTEEEVAALQVPEVFGVWIG